MTLSLSFSILFIATKSKGSKNDNSDTVAVVPFLRNSEKEVVKLGSREEAAAGTISPLLINMHPPPAQARRVSDRDTPRSSPHRRIIKGSYGPPPSRQITQRGAGNYPARLR